MKKQIVALILLWITGLIVVQAQVGRVLSSVKLMDVNNHSSVIPYLGKKVFTLLYIDPDVYDLNDPLSKALKAKRFSKEKYGAVGVVNATDTWIPMSAIQGRLRQKMGSRSGSVILFDKDKTLSKTWALGKCNDAAVIMVVGKDSKVKYQKTIKTQEECKAVAASVLKIIEQEIH